MELALSLGGDHKSHQKTANKELGFCMVLGTAKSDIDNEDHARVCSSDPPLQLDLMPFSPVPVPVPLPPPSNSKLICFPWLSNKLMPERSAEEVSSPNSATVSSFQMEFSARNKNNKREADQILESERTSNSRLSDDDDDNALTRKKLRLSKDQSAFLEESFKEHSTLNPKQKLALAKQLNLRPRQVEVWFQNRRARTKLKQTEVDCEYLKRCCEKLTEENRRLQKEVQELRALKTPQPFYNQLPATTLTMCPSCERVASTTSNSPASSPTANPRLMFPFSHAQPHMHQAQAQAQAH